MNSSLIYVDYQKNKNIVYFDKVIKQPCVPWISFFVAMVPILFMLLVVIYGCKQDKVNKFFTLSKF
jgi:hypothetical protein